MNIVIISQNDTLFLPRTFDALISNLPEDIHINGVVLLDQSPYGEKNSILKKITKMVSIFGIMFFIHYAIKHLITIIKGNTVKKVLSHYNVAVIDQISDINSPSALSKISKLSPDVILSLSANQIFKKQLLEIPTKISINLHGSLLPRYRGLLPSFWVLKNEETQTGVTVFVIDEGIDSGPIITQRSLDITDQSQEQLITQLKDLGVTAIIEALTKIQSGNLDLIQNNSAQSSYYAFPSRKDVKIFKEKGKNLF